MFAHVVHLTFRRFILIYETMTYVKIDLNCKLMQEEPIQAQQ